ncbi:hypothetical protein ACGIF2_10575 [Cellulomonas sp. P22]|uniref:hypothetical protein n=1 Tax=Cellulomonas sp. P22 TaxID=3373189 RepID=UPI0037A5BDBF
MRARSLLFGLAALVGVFAVAPDSVLAAPTGVFAPAYDASTASSVRNLATALQSALMFDDDGEITSADDLADWGWTPGEHLAVTIWVDGSDFRVEAQDLRPGASRYVYSSTTASVERVEGSSTGPRPEVAGVTFSRTA